MILVVDITKDEKIIYHAFHNYHAFQVYNLSVHKIIDQLRTGTDADSSIKISCRKINVWAVWNTICEYYYGLVEGSKWVPVARSNISKSFYNNKSKFSLKKILYNIGESLR